MLNSSGENGTFVAIAGSIATGKTGLATRLADALGADALLEDVAKNPYFDRFYEDPQRWAFHSQMAFATDSLLRHTQAVGTKAVVQDRTIYECVDVFSGLLRQLGRLSPEEFGLLVELRESAALIPCQPTVLVYLHAPPAVLLERVDTRGRSGEDHLTHGYMQHLDNRYERLIRDWSLCPILPVDTTRRDLRAELELQSLVEEIRAAKDK